MKTHLTRLRVIVAIAVAGGVCHREAAAQYLPYRPAPQTAAPYGYPAAPLQGQVAPQVQAAPQAYDPYQPQQQMVAQGQYPPYQPAVQQQYPAVAQSPNAAPTYRYPMVAQSPAPEQVMPNPGANGQPVQSEVLPGPANGVSVTAGQPANGMSGDVYQQGHEGHMQGQMQGYPQTNAGHGYPTTGAYGSYAGGYQDYGLGGYCDPACDTGNQWFGGIYFLFMERDNPSYTRLSVQADPPTDPYYPPAAVTILSTANVDHDYREGLELRFGSTFSISNTDPCNGCNTCATDLYAWEFAMWAIDDDIEWVSIVDAVPTDTYRMYGMVNHAGLEYDSGSGMRPVNDYYDYQMPIENDMPPVDGDIRVLAQRVRTNFRASNMELNFLRIPVCNVGCATASCGYNNSVYDSNGYGGYGCAPAACAPAGSSFSMAGVCGIRYFRMDDDMEVATEWATYGGGSLDYAYNGFENSANELFHDVNVDNDLIGFQLGANMNYCVACKWNFFLDSNFGLYNNHIEHYQRVYNPATGMSAYFTQTGEEATVSSSKDDLAFLGEMRLGGSYDISCNWRAVLAYRAVAISGVALSNEQIKPEMSNYAEVAYIDSSGSIIVHGVQAGVECRY